MRHGRHEHRPYVPGHGHLGERGGCERVLDDGGGCWVCPGVGGTAAACAGVGLLLLLLLLLFGVLCEMREKLGPVGADDESCWVTATVDDEVEEVGRQGGGEEERARVGVHCRCQ